MTRDVLLLCLLVFFSISGCVKPLVRAELQTNDPIEQTFNSGPNTVYYAIRWALADRGYPVGFEDLPGGVIQTAWVPVKSDSHYIKPFGTEDYGTVGAYHQLEVHVIPAGSETKLSVVSKMKSIVQGLHSNGREERAVLEQVQNFLRSRDVEVTNLGVE